MTTIADRIKDLEEDLKKRGLLKEDEKLPKPKKCQWCGGDEGCRATPKQLYWYRFTHEDGATMYQGWFSAQCAWLANEACEAVNNDNT